MTMFSLNNLHLLFNVSRTFQITRTLLPTRFLSKAKFNYLDPLKLQNQLSEDEKQVQKTVRNYASSHLLPKGKQFYYFN